MKAITLSQPYATLVADGLKRIETRSWRTSYRGPLAIHAAATYNGVGGPLAFDRICDELPQYFRERLDYYGTNLRVLPMRAVLAVTWLVDCIPAAEAKPDDDERAVGNYAPGRFAWLLREPIQLTPPQIIPGRQTLWDLPDHVVPEIIRRAISHAV